MTTVELALGAWMSFHAELGVDMEALLLPPATEQQIVAVEEQIGYRLPEDLRALYKIANGQIDPYRSEYRYATELSVRTPWAPLFGNYDFMPLDKALEQYLFYLDMYESENSFYEKYNKANPEKAWEPQVREVRDGDIVSELGWNPSWFSFAGSEANSYFVDMSPPRGGVAGQVVLYGADEWELQVVASSVTDLMDSAFHFLNTEDSERFDITDAELGSNDDQWRFVYFDMDWRNVQTMQEQSFEMPAEYIAWNEEQARKIQQQSDQFSAWLSGQGIVHNRSRAIAKWVSLNLVDNHYPQTPPPSVLRAIETYAVQQGQMDEGELTAAGNYDDVAVDEKATQRNLYLFALVSLAFDQTRKGLGFSPEVDATEAVSMYHQFKLAATLWTQQELKQANAVWQHVLALPFNKESELSSISAVESSNVDGSVVQICQSSFNGETFKSTDECHVINFNDFNVN